MLFAFWVVNYGRDGVATQYQVSAPPAVSLLLFDHLKPEDTPERDAVLARDNTDGDDDSPPHTAGATVPGRCGAVDRGGGPGGPAVRPSGSGSASRGR
ncbi:hypothetical protein GCM10009730_43570 [Streptomyces albidochromogenes]